MGGLGLQVILCDGRPYYACHDVDTLLAQERKERESVEQALQDARATVEGLERQLGSIRAELHAVYHRLQELERKKKRPRK